MGSILQDLRYGFKRLRWSPGFAAMALVTLALGIGAITAIFTLTYQVQNHYDERAEQGRAESKTYRHVHA
jgi:hypothetical protein